jgi:hypothetical protein
VQIGSAQAGAPGVANRNVILNSAFDIWQRGTTVTNPSNGSILADRWLMIYDGTGLTKTVSRQTFTPGSAPIAGVEEAQYFIRTAQTVAGSGATYNVYQTRIEDARVLAGQTATVSFYARAGSTITLPNVNVQQVFGSGGSPQTFIVIASNVSVGTSWNRYSYTFTMPSITGKTLGTNSFLVFEIGMPLNSTYTFDLWGVQLEPGAIATPFQRNGANAQAELAACQRYFEVVSFVVNDRGQIFQNVFYAVTKRTAPTLALSGSIAPANLNSRANNYFTVDGTAAINAAVTVSASSEL